MVRFIGDLGDAGKANKPESLHKHEAQNIFQTFKG